MARLELEYDGGRFAGWARQPGKRTVEEEVSRALGVLLRVDGVELTVAGRTDSGVHAWGQVASYRGPPVPLRGLNALLPEDVCALSCSDAPPGFDARRDASSRAYCYRVLTRAGRPALSRGRVLHWPFALDLAALSDCASALVGRHDFTAFTPTQTEHVRFSREVFAAFWRAASDEVGMGSAGVFWRAASDQPGRGGAGVRDAGRGERDAGSGERDAVVLEFWIEADAFMRHMNRVLVGTMLEVASGRRSVASFVELLDGQPRSEAGPTAAACGLYLAGVGYGGERLLAGMS